MVLPIPLDVRYHKTIEKKRFLNIEVIKHFKVF